MLGSLGSEREKVGAMRHKRVWMQVSNPETTSDILDILEDLRFIAERDFLRGEVRRDPPAWRV